MMRRMRYPILATILLGAAMVSATSGATPEDRERVHELAANLDRTAKTTLAVCRAKYEAAFDSGQEPTPCAQVVDVEIARGKLTRALKDARVDPAPADEYWTTWESVRGEIAARDSDSTKADYQRRQNALADRLNQAGTRLEHALAGEK